MKKKELRKRLNTLENFLNIEKIKLEKEKALPQVEINRIKDFSKRKKVKIIIDKIKLIEDALLKNNKTISVETLLNKKSIDFFAQKEWEFFKNVFKKEKRRDENKYLCQRINEVAKDLDNMSLLKLIVISFELGEMENKSPLSVKEQLFLLLTCIDREMDAAQKTLIIFEYFKKMDLREIFNEACINKEERF